MAKTKVAIIGNGIIGENHITAYGKIADAEIVAICDINKERLDYIGDRHEIKNRYTHIGKMLAETDAEAVDVCLHNNLHAPVTRAVLESGRNAYCEKPMAGSYADALSMYETAQKTGKMLHIQLAYLYDDATKAAKKFIDAGLLGKIYHMRSVGFRRRGRPFVDGYATKEFVNSYTASGGALFDMAVYRLSQVLYLAGLPKLERVVGHTYRELPVDPVRQEISGFDVEELGLGLAHYENGLTLDVIESWAIHMDGLGATMIAGNLGGIKFDPFTFHNFTEDIALNATLDLGAMNYRNSTVFSDTNTYENSQAHWIHALRGECPLMQTAEIALNTQFLQEGIFLSNKLGREITADEIKAMTVSKELEIPNLAL